MATPFSYPIRFGSPRRDGSSDGSYAGVGEITWSTDLGLDGTTLRTHVLLGGGTAIVVAGFGLASFNPADGARRWERRLFPNGPAAMCDGRVYHQNADRSLGAASASGEEVMSGAPMPSVDAETSVTLLWPQSEDFVQVAFTPAERPEPEDLDAPPPLPTLAARRAVYGEGMARWAEDYEGRERVPPLYLPESGRLLLGFDQVRVIDVNAEEELDGFALPLRSCVDWCANEVGELFLLGYDEEDRKAVVALSASYEEQWRWVDEGGGADRWAVDQPPVLTSTGRVYALTEGRVLALDAGTLTWSFDVRSDSLRHGASRDGGSFRVTPEGVLEATETLGRATALPDGSLLCAGGRAVRHLTPEGYKRLEVLLGEDVLSPPVVTEDGGLLVATSSTLFRFD